MKTNDKVAGWGGFFLAVAASLIAFELDMVWWKIVIVFVCVSFGSVAVVFAARNLE